jgi:hypothetical protein
MRRLRSAAAMVAALTFVGSAAADDYYPIDAAHEQAGLLDRSSLIESGGIRSVRLALVSRDPQGTADYVHYVLELTQQYDCGAGRYRTTELAIYNGAGAVTDRTQEPAAGRAWETPRPDTNASRQADMVCGRSPWAPGPIQADLRGGLPIYRRLLTESETAFVAYAFDNPGAASPLAADVLREMKTDFPQLSQDVRTAAVDDAASDQPDSVVIEHVTMLQGQFVVAHLADIARAPDDALLAYISAQAAMLQAMRQIDPAICASLSVGIAPAAAAASATTAPASSAFNVAVFKTIRAGMDRPVTRPALQANEVTDLTAAMRAVGEPQELISATFTTGGLQSHSPADRCEMSIDLDLALGKLSPEEGARVASALQAAAAKMVAQHLPATAPAPH